MKLKQFYLTKNDCYKQQRYITPKGIMVHSTGANNPTIKRYVNPDDGQLGDNKYNNDWNQPGVKKCVHAFIGKIQNGDIWVYNTLPWNMRGWHAGDDANNTHISFEICEDDRTDAKYFATVYQTAVELVTYLCKTYNLDPLKPGVVIDHREGRALGIASNHGDVAHWFPKFGKSMDTLRADVAALLKAPALDNTPDAYAKASVDKAVNAGILKGDTNGNLMLHEPICRQDMCVILDRAGVI